MTRKSIFLIICLIITSFALQAQETAKDSYKEAMKNFKKGLFDNSIEGFTKAIEMDQSYSDAYFYRAQAFNKTNRPEQAIQDYDAVNMLTMENVEAWLNSGNLNYDLKNFSKASEKFAVYLNFKKRDLQIYNKQIKALYKIDAFEEALNYAKLSLDVKDLMETYYTIGDLEFILKNYEVADRKSVV